MRDRHLQIVLKDMGLAEKEIQAYLAVLALGEASIDQITNHARIPRSSTYAVLENLTQKQFIEVLIIKNRKFFIAKNPQKILELLERHIKSFNEILPELNKLSKQHIKTPHVLFFEGTQGVHAILQKILEEKRPVSALTAIDDMMDIAGDYFEEFIHQRISQNLPVRLITNKTEKALAMKKKDGGELRKTRFVPRQYEFDTANYIFGDNVALFSLKQKPIAVILIKDRAIAATQLMYFEIIWEMASTT